MTDKKHEPEKKPSAQPTSASLETHEVPASKSTAPAVPLAGVPETPLPAGGGGGGLGPAVPSTDHSEGERDNAEDIGKA